MSSAFTEEQQNQIREQLFETGIRLSKELGVQRMTVSKLAAAAGIAKGSFYNFFESKETFILALCGYAGQKTQEMFMRRLNGRSQMTTHEFMEFLREYMNSEYDLLNGLTIEDVIWIKTHMADAGLFEPTSLVITMQTFFKWVFDMQEMWIRYVEALQDEYRVLMFEYPLTLNTNQKMVIGLHAFLNTLKITKPVILGASDGGALA